MPKTKLQGLAFTLLMVFFMVYCMTVYSITLGLGSLEYKTFILALEEMWIEYVVVFLLEFFVISRIVKNLASKIVNPDEDKPLLVTLTIQLLTVACTVPVVTLVVTLIHNGLTPSFLTLWLTSAALCLPAALVLQVFYVGPLTRKIFQTALKVMPHRKN